MGDWVILRFPFDDPEKPEVIEVLANVPTNWKGYLKEKQRKSKKKEEGPSMKFKPARLII